MPKPYVKVIRTYTEKDVEKVLIKSEIDIYEDLNLTPTYVNPTG